jgi:hypothetical protein
MNPEEGDVHKIPEDEEEEEEEEEEEAGPCLDPGEYDTHDVQGEKYIHDALERKRQH